MNAHDAVRKTKEKRSIPQILRTQCVPYGMKRLKMLHGSTRIARDRARHSYPAVTGRARQGFTPALCGGKRYLPGKPLAARGRMAGAAFSDTRT